jgi:hypothetical protein
LSRRMGVRFFLSILCLSCPMIASARADSDIKDTVQALISLCVGGGSTETLEAEGKGDVALTLKKLLAGEIGGSGGVAGKYSKSEWQGLIGGLNSQMTQMQADQADKVRECLKPYMPGIVEAVLKASK